MASNSTRPTYINETGADLSSKPPFFFRGVTSRVFPIKANMARLTFFCDQYLNMEIPPRIGHFRPALPYVYLVVLNYGSMSPTSVDAQNLGWVAQHEVLFMVPLEWWREEKGRLVFHDWACVSPFIFVDDEVSLITGREVYGWPKVSCTIESETPLWTEDPRSPTRLFSMSTPLFPRLYEGEREEPRTLIHIDREPALSLWQFPPDPFNHWNPLAILSNAAQSTLALMQEAADLMTALPVRGYRSNREFSDMSTMVKKAGGVLFHLFPDLLNPGRRKVSTAGDSAPEPSVKQITLKQFRDAQDPSQACYQALVASSMGLDRVNRSGLLGDVNLLRGDPSGGFTIRMYCYSTFPIVESLGLEVLRKEEGEGAPVAILKPTFPFWTDVDMYYGPGEVICSRAACCQQGGPCKDWETEENNVECCAKVGQEIMPAASSLDQCSGKEASPDDAENSRLPYNNSCGAATQPVAGPFDFKDVTLQVYPLLADPNRLRTFLDDYLNEPLKKSGLKFNTFGSYVYLMATIYGQEKGKMSSENNNIGSWTDKEVSFCLPVKVYRGDELITLGMVSPFVYGNSGRAVITNREVNGSSEIKATIESPPDVWLNPSGPVADRLMLKLDTEVFPALHMGQEAVQRTLIEIDGRMPLSWDNRDGWDHLAAKWREPLLRNLERKTTFKAENPDVVRDAKALALEILAQNAPVNFLTLKQYRDAKEVDRACYQALVKTRRSVSDIWDIREWENRLHVRIHKYPGFPIAKTLGLTVKYEDSQGDSVVQYFQPIRPFWMRLSVKEALGEVLCWRTKQEKWNLTHPWTKGERPKPVDLPYFEGPGLTRVGPALATEGALWHGLRDTTKKWLWEVMDMELRVIQKVIDKLATKDLDEFKKRLSPSLRDDLKDHKWDIVSLGKSKGTQEIYRVLEEVWPPFLHKVLNKELRVIQKVINGLSAGDRKKFSAGLSPSLREDFTHHKGNILGLARSQTTSELYQVLEDVATSLLKSGLDKELKRIAEEYQKLTNRKESAEFKAFKKRLSPTLHKVLDKELRVIQKVINGLSAEDRKKFSAGLSPSLREDFTHHKGNILGLATFQTTSELYQVLEDVATSLLKSGLDKELKGVAEEYQKLTNRKESAEFKGFKKRLNPTLHRKLAHAGENGYDINELWKTLKWDWDKFWVAKELARALGLDPSESLSVFPLRLSREVARDSIERLEDVQIVIDCILSDEWGNWGDPRKELRGHGLDKPVKENAQTNRNPDFCIPCNSFGSAGLGDEEFPRFKKTVGPRETKWWEVRSEQDVQVHADDSQTSQETPEEDS